MVESHGSFSKAGYGEGAAFPRKKLHPFSHHAERTCFTPRASAEATPPHWLPEQGPSKGQHWGWQRRAGLNPSPLPQSQGCHPAPPCSPPVSIPSLLLGQACKGP